MSDFHGGFFVEKVDAALFEPIRRAMRDYLFRETKRAHLYEIAFAVEPRVPVMHVAVRGDDADGDGYASFHYRHAKLGAEIAKAAGATVHAYHYENQAGSEGVTTFSPTGERLGSAHESWDDFAEREGIDDEDDENDELFAKLPLGKLAAQLGVGRSTLDYDLAYDTPPFRVKLVGDVPRTAFGEYLRRR